MAKLQLLPFIPYEQTDEKQIDDLGWKRPPEWRMHLYLERCLVIRPHTIVVGGLHTEGVAAGWQVVIGGTGFVGGGPFVVESIELIAVEILLGRDVAQCREREGDGILIVRETDFTHLVQCLGKLIGTHLHTLVEERE